MILPELNEAIANFNTEDDYEQTMVFRQIYHALKRWGVRCFDKDGNVNGIKGEMIIQRLIEFYTYVESEEKAWRMRCCLRQYHRSFSGNNYVKGQPEAADYIYLPAPAHRHHIVEW